MHSLTTAIAERALVIHQRRASNIARNFGVAPKYDAQEQALCLSAAKTELQLEAEAFETEQARIASMAHLSEADLKAEMDRLEGTIADQIAISSTDLDKVQWQIYWLGRELVRRIDADSFALIAKVQSIHADTAEMWAEPTLQAAE